MAARTAPDSIALPAMRSDPASGAARKATRGATWRLALLLLAFIALPLVLYESFRAADAEKRAIVLSTTQAQVDLIAAGLRPLLDRDDPAAVGRLDDAVRALAAEGRTLRVIRTSRQAANEPGFLVAAHPAASETEFAAIRAKLRDAELAGLDRATCKGSTAIEARVAGAGGDSEILAAAALVATPGSCWTILIGWMSAPFLASSLGRPYWRTREIAIAGAAYLALMAVVLANFLGLSRKLRAVAPTNESPELRLPAAPGTLVARVEQDLGDPTSETLDLRKHVADLVFRYHEDVSARGLSFSYEAVQPAAIRGTRSLIDGAVINLLDTALAASRAGDVVRVIVRTEDGTPRLIVEDGGHTRAAGDEAGADRRDVRHAIWVAHRNVEAMGGHLMVEIQANGVSRFIASFPQAS